MIDYIQILMKKYNTYCKADYTVIYFTYKKMLYRVALDYIPFYMVKITYSSHKNGHKPKLQLNLNNDLKRYILKYYTVECLGYTHKILNKNSKYNNGYQVQRLEGIKQHDRIYKQHDSIPFWIAGDITDINGMQVQVKYQNAQICMLDTLARL